MIITFVHHSCFTVELEEHFFIFDYFRGDRVNGFQFNGILPAFPSGKRIFVFASHSHQDHFDIEILKWAEKYPDIKYILSKDIRLGTNYLQKNGINPKIKEQITFVRPLETYNVHDLKIKTLRSTDAGVAFLVTAEGKNIYHAGDLNLWKWEGAGDLINSKEAREYKWEINQIHDIHVDIAFVLLDSRQKEYAKEGMDYFIKTVRADTIFPMHMWQDYSWIRRYIAESGGRFNCHLVEISGENEAYEI